ncbi:MAG: Crp/Fnr family transcriptional regulator [Methylococcales bacterium]|nr:Crp/Fnr family transcriptional regulator [Methylococcales bacterium]
MTLSNETISNIKKLGCTRHFQKKSIIFFQGDESDSFYFIEQGQVKVLILSQSGRNNLLRVLSSGEYFGELGLLDNKSRSTTIEALVDTQLTVVSKEKFITYFTDNDFFSEKIIPSLIERIRNLTEELTDSRVNNAYFCFRTKLYKLATVQKDGTYLIENKFTQQEMGEFVGTARENINRFIVALKKGGYIKVSEIGQWVIVKQLPQNW